MPRSAGNLKRLFSFARPYARTLFAAVALVFVSTLFTLAIPLGIRGAVDALMVRHDMARLRLLGGAVVLLALGQAVVSVFHNYLIAYVGQRVMADMRVKLYSHLSRLSLSFFTKRRIGELLSRLTNDVAVVQNVASEMPVNLVRQTFMLVGGLSIIVYLNWRLTLLILLIVPAIVLTAWAFGRRVRMVSTQLQDSMADVTSRVEAMISGIRIIKSFVREEEEEGRFRREIDRAVSAAMRRVRILSAFGPLLLFEGILGLTGILFYAARDILKGAMTPGELVAFVVYGFIVTGPIGSFARVFSQIQETLGSTERIFEILDQKPQVADDPEAAELPLIAGEVRFKEISFEYEPGQPVLREVSFEISPGTRVALVGPSGGGKTTLINLLHRFYDPTSGSIFIDGHDIRNVRLASLYRQLGLVPQETILFAGTIRENILLGRSGATQREMIAAAHAANADEFIQKFPKGYDTEVGEKGLALSGGQRQRLAIARAVLKNPRLLILDEATAYLDTESEALVAEALERLMSGRTTFVIAHRLSTIQKADRILVIDRGRIVEEGKHEELLARRGLYYHLYTLKMAGLER